jgi:hypothetical protein
MTCSNAREEMLVAERSTLRGTGESDLARHIGECESCRRLAAAIEHETASLAAAIALRDPATADVRSMGRHRTRNAILVTALPIAATIAMAAVLLHRDEAGSRVHAPARSEKDRMVMNAVTVDVERGQTATVIRTQDPKVTIVWISPGGTQ